MCGTIFGLVWILGGIGAIILGLLGKPVDIGWKKSVQVRGVEAVVVGVAAIVVGVVLIAMTVD